MGNKKPDNSEDHIMPDLPPKQDVPTLLAALDGLPAGFRAACYDQAVVTQRQAAVLCRELTDNEAMRIALALTPEDLVEAHRLLPETSEQTSTASLDIDAIPAGVLPLSDLPEDHPLRADPEEEQMDDPPEETNQ